MIAERSRGATEAEWDALTAWWMVKRHIGRAAVLLGRDAARKGRIVRYGLRGSASRR